MNSENKKILVTGGAGMIGSNLTKALVNQGHDVFVVDNLWRGKIEYLNNKKGKPVINVSKKFYNLDLRDHEACLQVTKDVDVVYHLADIVAGINFVFDNELFVWRMNTLINSNILNASIENGVEKYIYVGTACSYPKDKQSKVNLPPLKEEDAYPANPESSYGWSKLMGEYEAELAKNSNRIQVGILRLHNVYGFPCELDPSKSQVIPALCRKAILYPEEKFVVWGSGKQRRAFVYIDDVIDALLRVLDKGMNKGVIQIGPSQSISIGDIAKKIVSISEKEIDIEFDPSKNEGDIDRCADWSKAKEILNWEPRTNIDYGLLETYLWCLNNLKS
ncbi:MAG: NAD-dependent epimerase/dehydratase family protein [Candidatus Paceibacterota bacterium]